MLNTKVSSSNGRGGAQDGTAADLLMSAVRNVPEHDVTHLAQQFIDCQQTETVQCRKYSSILMSIMQIMLNIIRPNKANIYVLT